MSNQVNTPQSARRTFLLNATGSLTTLAIANSVVYAFGAAFKDLDGSLVAGAKTCGCDTTQMSGIGCSGSVLRVGHTTFSVLTPEACWARDGDCVGRTMVYGPCNIE